MKFSLIFLRRARDENKKNPYKNRFEAFGNNGSTGSTPQCNRPHVHPGGRPQIASSKRLSFGYDRGHCSRGRGRQTDDIPMVAVNSGSHFGSICPVCGGSDQMPDTGNVQSDLQVFLVTGIWCFEPRIRSARARTDVRSTCWMTSLPTPCAIFSLPAAAAHYGRS